MATEPAIGAWIRQQLARHEWTAADLSRRLNVNSGRLSEWMSGKRRPSPASCHKLADVFNADPDAVLAIAGYRTPKVPLSPDDPKTRIKELIDRVPMSPQQANGLEQMLLAWLEADAGDKQDR